MSQKLPSVCYSMKRTIHLKERTITKLFKIYKQIYKFTGLSNQNTCVKFIRSSHSESLK